jgi:hypothetical protein
MSVVATEQIMLELCKETGEPGFQNQQTVWGCIFDAIRDLSLHAMPCWGVTEGLTTDSRNAICWPSSCVKPLMTFLTRTHTAQDGTLHKRSFALAVDDSLLGTINKTTPTSNSNADNDIWEFFRTDLFYAVSPYTSWNFGLGEVYGMPSGYWKTGVVTYDPPRRQSFINGCTIQSTDTFGCFYSSDGLSECPEYVPSQCKEAIEFFALAKYYRTRNPQLGELNRKNYKEEFHRLSSFESDEGITAWLDAFNSNNISAPKM